MTNAFTSTLRPRARVVTGFHGLKRGVRSHIDPPYPPRARGACVSAGRVFDRMIHLMTFNTRYLYCRIYGTDV